MAAKYGGEERREHHWHLDKTVSIGHLITTIAVAGSVFVWAMKMDSRVSVLENEQAHVKHTNERLELRLKEDMTDLKTALFRIESKLDTKADKR